MPFIVLMFNTRKVGTTIEQFRSHYENKHIPLIREALRDYLPISHTRYYFNGEVDYDCITKLEFRDAEHSAQFNSAFATSPRKVELEADQVEFSDPAASKVLVVEEELFIKF